MTATSPRGASDGSPPPSRLRRALDTYFRVAGVPDQAAISTTLWHAQPEPEDPAQLSAYRSVVLEQYKMYAEMADRVSARRGLANAFFLSLNTAIFTLVGVFYQHPPSANRWLLVVPWLVLVGQCLSWFWILRSYRQLNTAKYAVIGAIEERLPASPYWSAEWIALGEGKDSARYWPLSHAERWIPTFFAAAYTAGFLTLILI